MLACLIHAGVSYTCWRVLYMLACLMRVGVSYTCWRVLYVLAYLIRDGVSSTCWRVLYMLSCLIHVGVSYAGVCYMHALAYLIVTNYHVPLCVGGEVETDMEISLYWEGARQFIKIPKAHYGLADAASNRPVRTSILGVSVQYVWPR